MANERCLRHDHSFSPSCMVDDAMMTHDASSLTAVDLHIVVPSPGSPPGMTSSKSSKTSSLRSFGSDDDNGVLADVGHFEEIGLDDDTITLDAAHSRDLSQAKPSPNPYLSSYTSDLRTQSAKTVGAKKHASNHVPRELARPQMSQRDITSTTKIRPKFPNISTQFRDTSTQNLSSLGSTGIQRHRSPLPIRGLSVRSSSTATHNRRPRSPSPQHSLGSLSPRDASFSMKPQRRSSWQSTRERKSVADLERECDEDDDDNIPEGFILDNVPISPRPPTERTPSRPASTSTSPERAPKERIRSTGNGTPAVATAQGSLRSPSWRSEASSVDSVKSPTGCTSPIKGRAKSWTAALSELSAEARALTEKLEEHSDLQDERGHSISRPAPKPRVKSALAELPPLRRTNIMIDPLPISKEKEAVLSRTRPSWLPPKDPAEEKRHLKEYQKMMTNSFEADKRREAARLQKDKTKDAAASNLMRVWEEDVLARWNDAIRERRTRELWWKGIAPRCRGKVWMKAIGNDLGLSEMGYNAALSRAKEVEARVAEGKGSTEDERRAAWFKQIRTDVAARTWVDLKIFQNGAPLHQSLVDVLYAYAMYRSDIGYMAGCNAIAALLLLNLPSPTTTFIALANLLNRPLPLSFFANDNGAKSTTYNLLLQTLSTKAPALHQYLTARLTNPEEYLFDMFRTLFTKCLSLDEVTRLWDVWVFEGDTVLVRAGVAMILEKEGTMEKITTSEEAKKVLEEGRNKFGEGGKEDQWMARVREAGKA